METYEIGDVIVLLDEISAIESMHKSSPNYVYVPIILRGGMKTMACIRAKDDEVSSSDAFNDNFVGRFYNEWDQFKKTWQEYIKNKK